MDHLWARYGNASATRYSFTAIHTIKSIAPTERFGKFFCYAFVSYPGFVVGFICASFTYDVYTEVSVWKHAGTFFSFLQEPSGKRRKNSYSVGYLQGTGYYAYSMVHIISYERRSTMNTTTNSKPIIGRGYWLRFLAVLLTLVMVMGTIPASAAKKTSSVEVSTKASLVKAIKKDGKATITLKTDKAVSIKIPSTQGSTTKKLVIDAPNASITNKTQFDTSGKTPAVTIKAVKYYTESVSGNTITLSGDGARINVSEKKTLKSLTVNGDNADICVRKKGKIENLTLSLIHI